MEWSIELGWKTAGATPENHTVTDPAKLSRPVFQWKIADKQIIEIPLVDDHLDLAAATLPSNVTLEGLRIDDSSRKWTCA